VAIVAAPAAATAQTQPQPRTAQANPAAEHLTAARAALNKALNSPAPSADAFKKMAELKTEYLALEKAASSASPEWATHYQSIERLLTELVGTANAAEPGAVGTSGQAGKQPDPALTANLLDFRTHLAQFSKAMAAVAPPAAGSAPAAAAPTAPAATAPPATAPAATAPPASADPAAQLDQVVGMIDSLLKANAAESSGTVSIERSMLEQMKTQLEQIRASVKKQ